MFRDTFDRLGATIRGKRNRRGPSVVSAPSSPPVPEATDLRSETAIDESFLAISHELSSLATQQVPQAAKERGWASLQRELERRPVRAGAAATNAATAGAGAKGAVSTGRASRSAQQRFRLGLAAAAAIAVVVVAIVLGTYDGGGLQTAGSDTTTDSSVVVTDTTVPDTTPVTPGSSLPDTTESTEAPTSTEPSQPETTVDVTTPDTTGGSSGSTTLPTTPGGSTNTSGTNRPPTQTTQPPRTTTTGETMNAAAQREGSAKAAAAYLANIVLTGDSSGARGLVASEAQGELAQMIMSLDQPFGYRIPASGIKSLTGDTVRVTVDIDDRVLTANGEQVEMVKTYYIQVRVDEDGALITAINAGPQRGPQ